MRVAVFNTRPHDEVSISKSNTGFIHALEFFQSPLNSETVSLARGFLCVCASDEDDLGTHVMQALAMGGTRLMALRCPNLNRVDLAAAWERGITVVRVPTCSPHAVAEHTLALILALSRRIPRACERVKDGNLSHDGLVGLELSEKTAGIIGTGAIGRAVARILEGFGCSVIGYDLNPNLLFEAHGVYASLEELLTQSDIVTLHCPLTADTHHLIGRRAIKEMKDGVMLINTSHSAVLSPTAVVEGIKSGKIGYLGIDLYEDGADSFVQERTAVTTFDDILPKLFSFRNVLITNRQGHLTQTSLDQMAAATLENITEFERTGRCHNAVTRISPEYAPRLHAAG